MSNTYRKGSDGKTYKESLKKKEARYRCRCEYCLGVSKNLVCEKIAEKEMKEEIRVIEMNEHLDFDIPGQEEIINKYNTQWKKQ